MLQNDGNHKLFPGTHQYNRFLKIYHQVLNSHADEILALGVDPKDLGSHSTQKGSATHVSSGTTVSPPMSAICLRAGWSMGSVKDRYIHHESAGDQFVGQTVTGLSCLSTDFACSPCYFDFSETEDEELLRQHMDEQICWNVIGGRSMTPKVRFMTIHFLACICYHYEYLQANLHCKNRLLSTPIFSLCPENLRKLAVVKYPWNKTRFTPFLTGVPPHILILSDMRRFEAKLDSLSNDVIKKMKEELNRRDIGGGMHHALIIQEDIRGLREELNRLRMETRARNGEVESGSRSNITATSQSTMTSKYHSYDGYFNVLPKMYKIPSLTFASFILSFSLESQRMECHPFEL